MDLNYFVTWLSYHCWKLLTVFLLIFHCINHTQVMIYGNDMVEEDEESAINNQRFPIIEVKDKDFNIYFLLNITRNDRNQCNENELVNNKNNDQYIKPELRHKLCMLSYQKVGKSFDIDYNETCFKDSANARHFHNPCAIKCVSKFEGNKCFYENSQTFLLINIPCGPNQLCNIDGCCIDGPTHPKSSSTTTETSEESTPEQSTVTLTQTTTETTTPIRTTTETSTPIQTTTEPTTPTQTTTETTTPTQTTTETSTQTATETTTQIQTTTETSTLTVTQTQTTTPHVTLSPNAETFTCPRPGFFATNAKSEFYYYCQYFASLHHCGTDKKFSLEKSECILDLTIDDPALPPEQWIPVIQCIKAGTFQSPYDCRYYFECVQDADESFRIFFYRCPSFANQQLVYNETLKICDYKKELCHNVLTLPHTI